MKCVTAIALGLVLATGVEVRAEIIQYLFPLDGSQEVPPVSTNGTGVGHVTLDTATNTLSWNIAFQDLTANVTASHFHGPAAPGSNAGVKIGIAGAGATSPIVGSTTITDENETQILAGLWYVNVHTSFKPTGEIRGQVVTCTPCDTNCDGSVNGQDITGFIDALNGAPSGCSLCNSDANGDGSVNGQDIGAFIACLTP